MQHLKVGAGLLVLTILLSLAPLVGASKPTPAQSSGAIDRFYTSSPTDLTNTPCDQSQTLKVWNLWAAGLSTVTADIRAYGAGSVTLSVNTGGTHVLPVTSNQAAYHLSAPLAPAPGQFVQIAVGANAAACPGPGVTVDALTVGVTP